MSITDELRKYADGLSDEAARKSEHGFSPVAMTLEGIADRIDVEHEAACAEAYGNGVMSVPIALDESQWVKLPVDADGVPIRVGDVMEWCDSGETLTVEGIGRDVLFYIDGENAEWTAARNKRHHHEPTVEDVLREFLCVFMGKREFDGDAAEAISEYAAKLRLVGDAE